MRGRLFVALPEVPLPEEQEERLRAWLGEIPGLRIAASRHITLLFLGDCDSEEAGRARLACQEAAAALHPCGLTLDRLTGLPAPGRARAAVLRGSPQAPLAELADSLRERMLRAGVPHDPRPFLLHMTVGRMRQSVRMATRPFGPLRFPVQEFHLLRSEIYPCGTRHECIARFPLSGC